MSTNTVSLAKKSTANLWISGLLSWALAFAGVLLLFGIAKLLAIPLQIRMGPPDSSALVPLALPQLVPTTLIPALAATALYAGLRRIFQERARRIFQVLAAAVLILSLGAPLSLPASPANTILLALMHIVTAAAIVWTLTLRE